MTDCQRNSLLLILLVQIFINFSSNFFVFTKKCEGLIMNKVGNLIE